MLVKELNELNKNTEYFIFPHIIGRLSHHPKKNKDFNQKISKTFKTTFKHLIIETNASKRIETEFPCNKQLMFALLISHNTKNDSFVDKHTSVAIFRKQAEEFKSNIIFMIFFSYFLIIFQFFLSVAF